MQIYQVLRFSSQNNDTLGLLFRIDEEKRHFLCYTLEDEYRTEKEFGETRIPAGTYKLELRTEGGFHNRYKRKFGSMHKGMLHVTDVENFTWVLIHIGNKEDNTAGCLLVGDQQDQNTDGEGALMASTTAYRRIYPEIAGKILDGEDVFIQYIDFDGAEDKNVV